MTRAVLVALALGAALLQTGAAPAFFVEPASAPLLPVALLAAWGTLRTPSEVWPALPVVALPLGLASEERVGWFLLALLPTAAILFVRVPPPAAQRLARAPLAAGGGALGYLVLLFAAGGQVRALHAAAPVLAGAALGTALVALALSLALWPLRVRSAGLFG